MSRVLLYETVFPDYRMRLFQKLKVAYGNELTLACGSVSFSRTLCTHPSAALIASPLKNRFFAKRSFLWQDGLMPLALEADLVIAEFSLRAISTWRLLACRRQIGKPTVLWGHAAGSRQISKLLRRWMINRCAGFITYMPGEMLRLRSAFPDLPIWVAPNAMMWADECNSSLEQPELVRDVIYVGRLVAEKKPLLLLNAFIAAVKNRSLPVTTRLLLIGDGPERIRLAEVAVSSGLATQIMLPGHINGIDSLREYYSRSIVAISPGYVGLSAIQSFSFGVPMLIADQEHHSPEIEACRAGFNCDYFHANDEKHLADMLGHFYKNRAEWLTRREAISNNAKENYSFDAMLKSITHVISSFSEKV